MQKKELFTMEKGIDGMADPDLELGEGLLGCPTGFFSYNCNFLCKI